MDWFVHLGPRALTILGSLLLAIPAPAAIAQSVDPSIPPLPKHNPVSQAAIDAVRAVDPRFADIPEYEDAAHEGAVEGSLTPLLAGSWIRIIPIFGTNDPVVSDYVYPDWLTSDTRLVEVVLVEDCTTVFDDVQAQESPAGDLAAEDPCGYRNDSIYLVGPEGTPSLVKESRSSEK